MRRRVLKPIVRGARARIEESDGVAWREWSNNPLVFTGDTQSFATGHHDVEPRLHCEDRRDLRGGRQQVLEIVEHDQ